MSFGVGFRNSIALGLGGIIALFSGITGDALADNLEQENGFNLLQEDGSFILLE
jgi:hypothetical protein